MRAASTGGCFDLFRGGEVAIVRIGNGNARRLTIGHTAPRD
jgi:hypothetical protein